MAHHEEQPTAIESVLELLSEHGLGAMAEAMQTLLNEAMKLEPSEFLRALPGERTDDRTGYANGFKDKTMRTRDGELALRIPQARPLPGGESLGFYPKSLERGLRSERALKLAIAEMYVQGVLVEPLPKFTERTPVDRQALQQQLKAVTSNGYAIDMGEHLDDVRAVATPVRDYASNVVGVLAIVGPAYRFQAERIDKELGPLAVKAGRELSGRLGFDAGTREAV